MNVPFLLNVPFLRTFRLLNSISSAFARSGLTMIWEGANRQGTLTLQTPAGQKVAVSDSPGIIEITDSNGNSVRLEPSGITVTSAAKVTVNAGQVEINAGQVSVNAGQSKFSGVVECDTLIASSVVASTYTPGAGNIW